MCIFKTIGKKTPKYKSYDVVALRWTGTVTKNNQTVTGLQLYKDFYSQVNAPEIDYAYGSGNFKYFSNGVGLSQNLVDSGSYFTNILQMPITCSGNVSIYGTYQHVQEDISLSQSQLYTLSSNGYGNVVLFQNSVKDLYDNTPGLNVSFTC